MNAVPSSKLRYFCCKIDNVLFNFTIILNFTQAELTFAVFSETYDTKEKNLNISKNYHKFIY